MSDKRIFVMLNGGIGVYSVVAETEEDAKRQIETELGPKAHRQYILRRWIEEGQPVRESKPKASGGKKK